MGLSELIFGAPAFLSDGINRVILTSVMSETETLGAEITKNAVEDGSNINDHVHVQPYQFAFKCFFADKNDLMAAAANLLLGADKTVTEKIVILKAWRTFGTLLTYSGPLFSGFMTKGYDIYCENMVISNLGIGRSQDNGVGVDVSISLQEIVIAQAMIENIALPVSARSRANAGAARTGGASASAGSRSILTRMFSS